MLFSDLLRTAVLVCAAAATALAAITLAGAGSSGEQTAALACAGWWLSAMLIGLWLGRRAAASPPIAALLADARSQSTLPEQRPTRVLLNRLWPLLLCTALAGGLGLLAPQIPGIAAGFPIIAALGWRRQPSAVIAIERRDGVSFFVEPGSPLRPIRLIRTPGFKAYMPQSA
ncbi:MAG: hypothetical protein NVSMB51_00590 [Solirubrobacteraceae bacterium]